MQNIREKQNRLSEHIQKQIYTGKLSPGDKIPPVRELMEQFELRYTSTMRAVNILVEKDLLERKIGNGTFVKKQYFLNQNIKPKKDKYKITIFLATDNTEAFSGIQSTVFLGVQEAAIGYNCIIELNYMNVNEIRDNGGIFKYDGGNSTSDAVIMLGGYDTVATTFDILLPVVGVGMFKDFDGLVSTIDIDPFSITELACQYFKERKKKHIKIVANDIPIYRMRANCFAIEWAAYGTSEVLVYQDEINFDEDGAYLFASGSMLQEYSEKTLEQHGKTLSEYTTVLGIDGKHLIKPGFHQTAAVVTDWKLAGKYALAEALNKIKNPGTLSKRIFLPGKLVLPDNN